MAQRHRLHIVDGDSRGRVHLARLAYDLGHHAEVYSGWDEFTQRPPCDGILVARDSSDAGGEDAAAAALAVLNEAGIWLPLILAAERPTTARVVAGIKQGALDFLELPLGKERLADAIARVAEEAAAQAEIRRGRIAARERVAALSRRERQVLDLLAEGGSNKGIARILGISPRTVEIHRAHMMTKLDANHAADAVRLLIEARLAGGGAPPEWA